MSDHSRREVLIAFPLLAGALSGPSMSEGQQSMPAVHSAPPAGERTLGSARAVPFDSVPANATANGGERRVMLHGTLATGENLELHQSMQMPGTPAPPFHVVRHSELILIREGMLKYAHEVDGKIVEETAGPGDVFYVAYGTNHSEATLELRRRDISWCRWVATREIVRYSSRRTSSGFWPSVR